MSKQVLVIIIVAFLLGSGISNQYGKNPPRLVWWMSLTSAGLAGIASCGAVNKGSSGMKKNIYSYILGVAVICLSVSCVHVDNLNIEGIKLNFPVADYSGIGWISHDELAAFATDQDGGVLGYYLENDDTLYSLNLPAYVADLDCKGPNDMNYTHPSLLPDGRLGLINGCVSRGDPPGLRRQYMVAYSFDTKEAQLLVKDPLPNYLSNGFTWNPDMTQGLQQIYNGLDGTIYWMSTESVQPVNFSISDGERSFLPAKDFPRLSDSDEQGIVFSPAWSPDGSRIVFFATLDAIGRNGFSRSDGQYQIFVMDPIEQRPHSLIGGIYDPFRLTWSQNSKWLAFIGDYGTFKKHGLWLYSFDSGNIHFIAPGEFSQIAWSSDGNKIAATTCIPKSDLLCDRYEVWEYDVSSIYQKNR